MTALLVLGIGGFLLVYGLLRLLEVGVLCKHVAAEPPLVRARVPIVGHVLGLLRFGVSYYRMLRFVLLRRIGGGCSLFCPSVAQRVEER